MALTTNEKQLSNRILNQLDSEKRRRLRKLTDTLEETGASEVPVLDYKYKSIVPGGTSGTFTGAAVTATGSAGVASASSSNLVERQQAISYAGTASTTSVGGFTCYTNTGSADLFLQSSANGGGFRSVFVFSGGGGLDVATARMFVGYCSRTAVWTDADPSSLTNIFGVGFDDTDTEVQFIHNDGSGTATKIPLGASFPKPSANLQQLYKLELSSSGGQSISYTLTELVSGSTTSGTVTTDLPAATVILGAGGYVSAGGTSTTSRIRLHAFSEIQPNVW